MTTHKLEFKCDLQSFFELVIEDNTSHELSRTAQMINNVIMRPEAHKALKSGDEDRIALFIRLGYLERTEDNQKH